MNQWTAAGGVLVASLWTAGSHADTRLRIMPPDRSTLAAGQLFDVRVETGGTGLRVFLDSRDITAQDTAASPGAFLLRGVHLDAAGEHLLRAETSEGAREEVHLSVYDWRKGAPSVPRAKNVILLLGDGMGAAHRTAARIVSRGLANGKARRPLAMDTLPVTGQVMTPSLNAAITDSSPGMTAYVTGVKQNNNQEGVLPDDTPDVFDNPRIEYLGELLRRERGLGFNVGIVTTADVTDASPAGNAVHSASRSASAGIAAAFVDERAQNAVAVLMGGGSRHFDPKVKATTRTDGRDLAHEMEEAGYERLATATELRTLLDRAQPPKRLLGLFSPGHMPVAFDKVGAKRYSDELALPKNEAIRDPPMLDDMARLALRTLAAHSPSGFYLMIEGASIDKRAHEADAERSIWDAIELDNAVAVALEFARKTNADADPANDTLVIVTADHETGGLALVGVGNPRYAPRTTGAAVRDYATVFRFRTEQVLVPNYEPDAAGYPNDPDPSRKLLFGWASAPDRYENWLSNRLALPVGVPGQTPDGKHKIAVANEARDGAGEQSDNRSVDGKPVPGFLVRGVIENGEHSCPVEECPADVSSVPLDSAGHTATDNPLSAEGPGALQFTGTYDNTDVMAKILRATTGAYAGGTAASPQKR
jgi:alkaline phosphatase